MTDEQQQPTGGYAVGTTSFATAALTELESGEKDAQRAIAYALVALHQELAKLRELYEAKNPPPKAKTGRTTVYTGS